MFCRTDTAKLDEYGWLTSWDRENEFEFSTWGLNDTFEDLGIFNDPNDWYEIDARHGIAREVSGIVYPPTQAQSINSVNFKDGAVVATNNYGPKYQIKALNRPIPDNRITPLWRWSDVFFLAWEQAMAALGFEAADSKKFEHMFRHNLVQDKTQRFLRMVTGRSGPGDLEQVSLSQPLSSTLVKISR